MNEDQFWDIIGAFDWSQSGDDDAVMERAQEALSELPVEDIRRFSDLLAGYLYAIDTREHARHGYLGEADPDDGDDYISPDDFLYLRLAVVANGRDFYERVAADPSQMPQDMEFESLLYLADKAYEDKTGEENDHDPEPNYESFSNTEGWASGEGTAPGIYTDEAVPPLNRRPV